MKIAIVSFGHVDVTLPLFRSLRNKGMEVDLIFAFALNRKMESIIDFRTMEINTGFLSTNQVNEILGKNIINYLNGFESNIKFFIFYNLKIRSFYNLYLSTKLTRFLKKYDIIHFNGSNAVLPYLIWQLKGKKILFTIHDFTPHTGEGTKFKFAEKFNEYLLKSKYPIILQNLQDYNALLNVNKKLKSKLYYLPFGILDIYKQFKKDSNAITDIDLLFWGRISPYKGIEYLIDAINILNNNKGIKVKTIIAGSGKVYFDTQRFDELNLVLINKYLCTEELVDLIQRAKIIVCPYTDATQSGVLMTAYAFNKPVIASKVGGFLDFVYEGLTGKLIQPRNSYDLAEALYELLSSPELLLKMSRNIEKLNVDSELSWESISEKAISIYKKLYISEK